MKLSWERGPAEGTAATWGPVGDSGGRARAGASQGGSLRNPLSGTDGVAAEPPPAGGGGRRASLQAEGSLSLPGRNWGRPNLLCGASVLGGGRSRWPWTRTCSHAHMHAHSHAPRAHTHTFAHIHSSHTCTFTHVHACPHVSTHAHVCAHIHAHTRSYACTCTHTHPTPSPLPPAGFPDLSRNRVTSRKRRRMASGRPAGRTGRVEAAAGRGRAHVRMRCWEGPGDAGAGR